MRPVINEVGIVIRDAGAGVVVAFGGCRLGLFVATLPERLAAERAKLVEKRDRSEAKSREHRAAAPPPQVQAPAAPPQLPAPSAGQPPAPTR